MSKLDYITVAIVGLCILAIIFLVYKMTDLFQDKTTDDMIETVPDTVEIEKQPDDTYDLNAEDQEDNGSGDDVVADADDADKPGEAGNNQPANEEVITPDEPADDNTGSPNTYTSRGGKFMVIAGTFTKKSLARNYGAKLKGLGFDNTKVEQFDRGKYAVVLVDRFSTMAPAERLVKDLKSEGIDAYIKVKEGNN